MTPDAAPFTENHPFEPNSPYSASKAASDHLVRAWHHTYGLPVLTTNCSNNYGPLHFPEKLIPLVIVNALAGKALPVTSTEVYAQLKAPPQVVFEEVELAPPNYLRFRVGPDVAIALGAHAKKAGPTMQGREVELFVSQQQADEMDAYERLIGEAMIGDTAHFARQDEVEAAWAVVDPVLSVDSVPFEYTQGTWGPKQSDDVIADRGLNGGIAHDAFLDVAATRLKLRLDQGKERRGRFQQITDMRQYALKRNEADIDRGKIRRLRQKRRTEIADVSLFD